MKIVLDIRAAGPDVEAALEKRAAVEARPIEDVARDILRQALCTSLKASEDLWKSENEAALKAYDRRCEERYERLRNLSAIPVPTFAESE